MARPGLMLYFDILPVLEQLPHAAVGKLTLAALHYAQSGAEPVFEDRSLDFAWAFLRPSIDRDGAAYEEKRLKGDWLVYCRQCKQAGTQALDIDTWRERIANDTLQGVAVASPTTTTTHLQPSYNTSSASMSTTSRSHCDPAVAAVLAEYLNRINPSASQNSLDELAGFVEVLGPDVCKRAFDIALDNKKTTWPYIRAILQDKQRRGVRCLADWDAAEEKRTGKEGTGQATTKDNSWIKKYIQERKEAAEP